MVAMEVHARDLQPGDLLVTFGWKVTTATLTTGDHTPYISVRGRTDSGIAAGTAFGPLRMVKIERPDPPTQPGVPREALLALADQWETTAESLEFRAADRALTEKAHAAVMGNVAGMRVCVFELRRLVDES